jgi:hypothetical protein
MTAIKVRAIVALAVLAQSALVAGFFDFGFHRGP